MSRGTYALLIGLPNLFIFGTIGRAAKLMEKYACKTRRLCVKRMRRVLDEAPTPESK